MPSTGTDTGDKKGTPAPKGISYRDAGVNLDIYERTLQAIEPLVRRTYSPRVLQGFGGFASLFTLDYNQRLFARNYRKPVLVACTDGVGTKLKVATMTGRHDTVGIDLVAMSVNDCLCTGGEPLLFLDYLAMAEDDPTLARQIVKGISDGCLEAECSLVGGETAIMPGFYPPGEYDLAGFCVGVVEKNRIVDGRTIRPGDVVLGLASSGLHSNGYSLARKIVFERAKLDVDRYVPELQQTVGEALLEPTRIYVRPIKHVLSHYTAKRVVRGMAHITGGGLVDNVPRILPRGCQVRLRRGTWPVPPVFQWLQALGQVEQSEMERVFNVGIGFVLIVSPYYAQSIQRQLLEDRVPCYFIGEVEAGDAGVILES
ncbi:MAG: phosphoribosylformylglycinamidine cyclo-ligase [Gemmataceae bacterium]